MPSSPLTRTDDARPWRHGVAELALACAGSYAADEAARMHELIALLQTCPPGIAPGLTLPDPLRLEELLAIGAGTTVAMELFDGAEAGFLLSRGGGGQHLASVILPGAAEEVSASGDSAGLALLGAIALALSDLTHGPALSRDLRAPDGLRLN